MECLFYQRRNENVSVGCALRGIKLGQVSVY